MHQYRKFVVGTGIVTVLTISVVLNFLHLQQSHAPIVADGENQVEIDTSNLPFLSKRVFITNQNDMLVNFVNLRTQLRNYVSNRKEPIGIYFEYLPSGVSIGVNDRQSFVFASLLKVPLVMAVYDDMNDGKIKKDQVLTIKPEHIDKEFGSLWEKGPGFQLTVDEAIRLVLTESDNTAKNALLEQLDLKKLDLVFNYLDIPEQVEDKGPVVDPKNYSSVLRSLYLASFLPKEQSNEILDHLTKSVHTEFIAKPIPADVQVAHKIGVYEDDQDAAYRVYTDCGIFYVPLRPYILCVMTNSETDVAIKNMQQISQIVYNYIQAANLKEGDLTTTEK